MATGGARVIVVDDDPVIRTVVSRLVEEQGGQVMAEADGSFVAIEMIERFEPEVVVLDMALAVGSGGDVLEHLQERHSRCQVVVFTAFTLAARDYETAGIRVVDKPLFEELERALAAAIEDLGRSEVATDRRRPARQLALPSLSRTDIGLDDVADFYHALADAQPGDALVGIPLAGVDAGDVAPAARRAVRAHDRMILRGRTLVILLVGGGTEGPPAVLARIGATVPDLVAAARVEVLVEGSDSTSAFASVSR